MVINDRKYSRLLESYPTRDGNESQRAQCFSLNVHSCYDIDSCTSVDPASQRAVLIFSKLPSAIFRARGSVLSLEATVKIPPLEIARVVMNDSIDESEYVAATVENIRFNCIDSHFWIKEVTTKFMKDAVSTCWTPIQASDSPFRFQRSYSLNDSDRINSKFYVNETSHTRVTRRSHFAFRAKCHREEI